MDSGPQDRQRVKTVFDAALKLDADARRAYVVSACEGDSAVRRQVEHLLAEHERGAANAFLQTTTEAAPRTAPDLTGRTVGQYRFVAPIGAGGMGEVYAAHDGRLDRPVALKLLSASLAGDADRLRRFHAEARAASSLNHPHILVVHDFGELDGRPFIVTELVEGETLRRRLGRGPVPVRTAVDIAMQTAGALSAAHVRGIVHRDIKPENIMIRLDGYVKVLDFGLAKLMSDRSRTDALLRTQAGVVIGTPRYMSPEQARGLETDPRTDVWSLGAVLFEMFAGRPPFVGDTHADLTASILHDEPPALDAVAPEAPKAIAEVVARALRKNPVDRYATAGELHAALSAAAGTAAAAAPAARDALAVLPLKILRSQADADFLAFSLPDAVAASLAERPGLAVRSPLASKAHGGADAHLATLAEALAARYALAGTLTCMGERIALRLQLLAIPAGTVLWSDARTSTLQELFDLQDAVAARVARALHASLGESLTLDTPARDVPQHGGAYALYLRANQLAYEVSHWREARELYRASVEADPRYAPAWARLARCERLLGKYSVDRTERVGCVARADEAIRRSLALNAELSFAHTLYAQLMIDVGRADEAMRRLLERLARRPADPELYAGLVHALRYCGLLDESIAAHSRARALDAAVPTSVHHTWWMKGEYQRVIDTQPYGGIGYVSGISLVALGREREAIEKLRAFERGAIEGIVRVYIVSLRTLLEGDAAASLSTLEEASAVIEDAEALYYLARSFARLGAADRAARELTRVVDGGFWSVDTFDHDAWLQPIRDRADVQAVLDRARQRRRFAEDEFVRLGGPALLKPGVGPI
jgi:serine/threonine-protein kinase